MQKNLLGLVALVILSAGVLASSRNQASVIDSYLGVIGPGGSKVAPVVQGGSSGNIGTGGIYGGSGALPAGGSGGMPASGTGGTGTSGATPVAAATSISPTSGSAGTPLTVTGKGFFDGRFYYDQLCFIPASGVGCYKVIATNFTNTNIYFTLPAQTQLPLGTYSLSLYNRSSGKTINLAQKFEVKAQSTTVISISPTSGVANSRFIVTGKGFFDGRFYYDQLCFIPASGVGCYKVIATNFTDTQIQFTLPYRSQLPVGTYGLSLYNRSSGKTINLTQKFTVN